MSAQCHAKGSLVALLKLGNAIRNSAMQQGGATTLHGVDVHRRSPRRKVGLLLPVFVLVCDPFRLPPCRSSASSRSFFSHATAPSRRQWTKTTTYTIAGAKFSGVATAPRCTLASACKREKFCYHKSGVKMSKFPATRNTVSGLMGNTQ